MNFKSIRRDLRGSECTPIRALTSRTLQLIAFSVALTACSSGTDTSAAPTTTAQPPAAAAPTTAPTPPATAAPTPAPSMAQPMTPAATPQPATPPPTAGAPSAPTPPTSMTPPPAMMPDMMPPAAPPVEMGTPTLFWLDIQAGRVTKANADGSMAAMFASGPPLSAPDGVTVDVMTKHVFVLNMGTSIGGANTGSLVRYNLDGSGAEVIMPPGSKADGQTFNTGKQVSLDKVNRKLYMGDREGSKVWRVDLDGKNLEVLVSGHGILQVVGVAPDHTKNEFYFSDRNGKKLFRASMKMPDGQTHADRMDLTLIYQDKAPNAMPLDLELDLETRTLFWTDRQQNKVFSVPMDMPAGQDGMTRTDVKTVASNLRDVIGLAYDHQEHMLYATHSGTVSRFKTDGSGLEQIGRSGTTGIAFARIP